MLTCLVKSSFKRLNDNALTPSLGLGHSRYLYIDTKRDYRFRLYLILFRTINLVALSLFLSWINLPPTQMNKCWDFAWTELKFCALVSKEKQWRKSMRKIHLHFLKTNIKYFDFAKAFDIVPHRRLLKSLNAMVSTAQFCDGLRLSFLTGRSHLVKVNGEKSKHFQVQSRVPQGSVLGMLPFVLYINDLP